MNIYENKYLCICGLHLKLLLVLILFDSMSTIIKNGNSIKFKPKKERQKKNTTEIANFHISIPLKRNDSGERNDESRHTLTNLCACNKHYIELVELMKEKSKKTKT